MHLYLKLFGPQQKTVSARAKAEPLKYNTGLYTECLLARGLNRSLSEYRKLPRRERRILYFQHILEGEKERFAHEDAKREAERKSPPSPARRSSVRR